MTWWSIVTIPTRAVHSRNPAWMRGVLRWPEKDRAWLGRIAMDWEYLDGEATWIERV